MSTGTVQQFKNVSYLWDEAKAAKLAGDEVALLIYRSNLLGADLRLTNYGGGNTSCKAMAKDPLTGRETEIMWVKGSGGDLGTLKRNGLAALYIDRLLALKDRKSTRLNSSHPSISYAVFCLKKKIKNINT